MGLRQLDPGSAWNEAERRAIPFAFVGFFLAGVICAFGYGAGIREPFLAGVCGGVGLFLAEIAFVIGFYSRKLALAGIATLLIAIFPTVITALLLPWLGSGKITFIPSIAVGIGLYTLLHRVHRTLSGLTFATYVHQLAYDQYGTPKSGWEHKIFWLLAGIGAATALILLIRK